MPLITDAAALVDEFAAGYPFALDEFQRRGCRALAEGRGTLVAAPTGAGKPSARAARPSTPPR
jgi:ATP-dependent RNA helicase HelY